MKKLSIFAGVILLTTFLFNYPVVNADMEKVNQDTTNFIKSSGVIKDIVKTDDLVTLTVESEDKEPIITNFKVSNDTLLFNSGTTKEVKKEFFQKGQRIDAYYDKNKPMLMIYPAQISPELVIVHDTKNFSSVKVGKFDEQFLSSDKKLKLKIDKETVLVNERGEKVTQKDLRGKELIVFYTIETKSIPAQTVPSKIVAINYQSPEMKEVQKIIEKDHFMQNGTKMIPLRKVAEQLGYKVNYHPKRNIVYLKLGNSSISIKRGEEMYGYNRSLRKFKEKPVVKGNETYVSEDILEILILDNPSN
ncbi:hypothetical protein AM499_18235 [Bacillus sp. FJAT-22090]|uniref:stalk domain-containing protein n=1 Tax=Bacillus sp. FJAT-22090 TaxID=1581038 RepID=UPI0006AF81B5|nr:stalk domain-containing protein [Bacillus sp. FJAT-22090]ALC87533.1 hypothetical protein AM499_18235 [Bacillus sp. FJAT-22090]